MQELVNQLIEKAGISQEQAHKTIDTIKDFIKDKFPMMAGAVDNLFPAATAAIEDPAAPPIPSPSMLDKISDFIPGEIGEKIESFAKDKFGG
ncbi:hypothetical protein BH11BAC4_BH11BAC4_17480 [soil metagenome]